MIENLTETIGNTILNIPNAGLTELIIYGLGFIGFCILGSLLTRKDRKENPGKYPLTAACRDGQSYATGSVVVNGQSHLVTRIGNTTYID